MRAHTHTTFIHGKMKQICEWRTLWTENINKWLVMKMWLHFGQWHNTFYLSLVIIGIIVTDTPSSPASYTICTGGSACEQLFSKQHPSFWSSRSVTVCLTLWTSSFRHRHTESHLVMINRDKEIEKKSFDSEREGERPVWVYIDRGTRARRKNQPWNIYQYFLSLEIHNHNIK